MKILFVQTVAAINGFFASVTIKRTRGCRVLRDRFLSFALKTGVYGGNVLTVASMAYGV
jgi:hypothetical protein